MKTATAGEPKFGFAMQKDEVLVVCVQQNPINIDYAEYIESGFPIDIDIVSGFAGSGALPGYPYHGIAIDTLVYNMAEDIGRPVGSALPKAAEHASRMKEMRWLGNQRELRVSLAGQWVALEGERLLSHGEKLVEVLKEAQSLGVEHPFVICLPESHEEEVAVIA